MKCVSPPYLNRVEELPCQKMATKMKFEVLFAFSKVNLQSFDSIDGDEERNSIQPSDVENQAQMGEQEMRHHERRSTLNSIMRKWNYWQPKVWSTLEEPNSSKAAQVSVKYIT